MRTGNAGFLFSIVSCFLFFYVSIAEEPQLGSARVVFQTNYGDIEFGFYPSVAPKTVDHIFKLVRLGGYNTNHFFRVDKGFVAQVADVAGGRTAPMNEEQRVEAEKKVVAEFSDVKHVRGILSMGRYSDPDSAQSSFSMLLGDAPHLDKQYTIFGKVTKGDETLSKLEQLPTRREGIFVMPKERITILSTYYYDWFAVSTHVAAFKTKMNTQDEGNLCQDILYTRNQCDRRKCQAECPIECPGSRGVCSPEVKYGNIMMSCICSFVCPSPK